MTRMASFVNRFGSLKTFTYFVALLLLFNQRANGYDFQPDPACAEAPDSGSGQELIHIWYFNVDIAQCRELLYRGYGGTRNRFKTRQDCEHRCLRPYTEGAEDFGPRIKPPVDHKSKAQKKIFSRRLSRLDKGRNGLDNNGFDRRMKEHSFRGFDRRSQPQRHNYPKKQSFRY